MIKKREELKNIDSNAVNVVSTRWIMLIYFCSGLCSLIDEVVWVRLLKLTLGNTAYASTIVVSVFMGGLALGAFIMGRYADKIRRRLRLYAFLEICAAISALSLPWILKLADGIYRWLFQKYQPSTTTLLLIQIIVSAGILLVPTMVMGSTLPLLGRYITSIQKRVGHLVGRLYAINTFGASLGCFLAGFILIRTFGVMETLYIAAGLNFFVAFGGWILSRSYDISNERTIKKKKNKQQNGNKEGKISWKYSILLFAVFLCGLISIGYELIWMRSIVFLLGGTTYVFSAVLTIYLLGNVSGAWIGSRLSKRLKHPSVGFGVSLTFLGLFGIIYINWLDIWHFKIANHIISLLDGSLNIPVIREIFWPLLSSLGLFLIPAITMGIGFPLALQGWSKYQHKVGLTTGTVYGVNTIGAVIGGLITGFLLIPVFGVQIAIIILGLLGVWLGVTMVQIFTKESRIAWRLGYTGVVVVITVIVVLMPVNLFERQFIKIRNKNTRLLAVEEGVNTTVSVHKGTKGDLTLATSGIQVAGDHRGFRVTQKILGHLGILLNKKTKRTLSVGFGSGESSTCMAKHGIEQVTVIEIAPELVEVSRKFFDHLNSGKKIEEKRKIIYMDAKNFLHLTEKKFDVIVSDAINPRRFAENASLYTKEYFQSASNHLNPEGIIGCWLPIREIPISCVNSIIGTFMEVFPYVTVWFPSVAPSHYDFLFLVGKKKPQFFSLEYIDKTLQSEEVRKSVDYVNLLNSHYVLSCYIGDQNGLLTYLKKYKLNSDYKPYIEFNIDINEDIYNKKKWLAEFFIEVRRNNIHEHIDWTVLSKDEQEEWRKEHELFYKVSTNLINSRLQDNPLLVLYNCYNGLKIIPGHASLIEQEQQVLSFTRDLLTNASSNEVDNLLQEVNILIQKNPDFGTALLIKSWLLRKKKEIKAALRAAEKAAQLAPYNAETWNNLGVILMYFKEVDKAIGYFNKAVMLNPAVPKFRYDLGIALAVNNQYEEAIVQLLQFLKVDPNNVEAHFSLGELYYRDGQKDLAIKEYQDVLRIDPKNEKARKRLTQIEGYYPK
jgi:spermidine synthase